MGGAWFVRGVQNTKLKAKGRAANAIHGNAIFVYTFGNYIVNTGLVDNAFYLGFYRQVKLTVISPITLMAVRHRSRNQSTVTVRTMCVGRPTELKTSVIVTRPASGIPAPRSKHRSDHDEQLLWKERFAGAQMGHRLAKSRAVIVEVAAD